MTGFKPSRRAVLAMPAILAAAPSQAADAGPAAIEALMRKAVPEGGGGAALAVVREGQILFQGGFGLAAIEYGVKVRPNTVFHIASCSKQFAALSIALLVGDGKVKLDEDIRHYLPKLPDYGERIEVQNLVHHTSGICDQWAAMLAAGWRDGDTFTQPDVMTVLKRIRTLNFKPGTQFDYSNGGYSLIAEIVERVSGMSMRQFGQQRMFGPLGMTRTFWRDDLTEVTPDRALSYTVAKGKSQYLPLSLATYGATGLNTTVEDLARWDAALYGGSIFSSAMLEMATTPRPLSDGKPNPYCFGLVVGAYRGLPTIAHAGADAGFRSNMVRFPQQRFSVLLLCNNNTIDFASLPMAIADLVLDGAFTGPAAALASAMGAPVVSDTPIPDAVADRVAGTYIDADKTTFYVARTVGGLLMNTDKYGFNLVPMPDGRFRSDMMPAIIGFTGDTGGHATGFRMEGGPKVIVGQRQPDVAYSDADLASFAGAYRSPDVDTVLRFAPSGRTMALRGLKLNEPALPIYERDLFGTADGVRLRFVRDAAGRCTAMLMSMPHLDDLRFDRVA